MDARPLSAIALLLTATIGITAGPAGAILPSDPICPLGPTTDPPVCVTPPPEPDVCQELYDVQQSLEPSPGLFREGCEPVLPECRDFVNQTEPVDPCEPRLECQDLLGAYELRPDPCQDPETTCQEIVGKTLVFREEACAPPTCQGVASDAGVDPVIAEAVCDTAKPMFCEETPETEEIDAPVNQSLLGEGDARGADCLPCVGAGGELESCSDLCLANEVTDCLLDPPGCEQIRSILGGSGQLFLNDGCVPQLPICDEFGVTNPPPNSFPVDCVPFSVPPSCAEVVGIVNEVARDYLPMPVPCGIPGPPDFPMDPPITPLVGIDAVYNFADYCLEGGTGELLPQSPVPSEAGFSCSEDYQNCSPLQQGEGDLLFLGTARPHGRGYISANEHNAIYDLFWFCRTKTEAAGKYYAVIGYENRLTAGDACNRGGSCYLASGETPEQTADHQEWSVFVGDFVKFAPASQIVFDDGECHDESLSVGPIGASWQVCAVKKLKLFRGRATAGDIQYDMAAIGEKRKTETPEYGVLVEYGGDQPNGYGFTFTYSMKDRFQHIIPGWFDHVHSYETTGSIGVYQDRIVRELL